MGRQSIIKNLLREILRLLPWANWSLSLLFKPMQADKKHKQEMSEQTGNSLSSLSSSHIPKFYGYPRSVCIFLVYKIIFKKKSSELISYLVQHFIFLFVLKFSYKS